jgi:hypothetical protein
LINELDEVVGVVIGAMDTVGSGDAFTALEELFADADGVAIDIGVILDEFRDDTSIDAFVATASTPGVVNTAGSAATRRIAPTSSDMPDTVIHGPAIHRPARPRAKRIRAPTSDHWAQYALPADFPQGLERLEGDLDRSERGRRLIQLWLEHQEELNRLVNENRRVAVVWHRNDGPALVQSLLRVASVPGRTLPTHLNERPLWDALGNIEASLRKYGTDALGSAMDEFRFLLPEVEGKNYEEIQAAIFGAPDPDRTTIPQGSDRPDTQGPLP